MKVFAKDMDTLSGSFAAYKLPTLIISIGLILAVAGFLMALNYELEKSERNFDAFAEQTYRTVDSEIRRHEQQITAVARFLGLSRTYDQAEFVDIANSFTVNTYFDYISLLTLDTNNNLVERFPSAAQTRKVNNLTGVQAIDSALEKSKELQTTYFSETFDIEVDEEVKKVAAFVAPTKSKYRPNMYLVGIIDIERLFQTTLQTDEEPINASIVKVTPYDEVVIYEQYEKENERFFNTIANNDFGIRKFERVRFFEDYAWKVTIFSSPKGTASNLGIFPWMTLFGLLALTTLVGYIAFRITVENVRIQHIVAQQTESLRDYTHTLEERNRDLDDFAYIASHDLKEPLRGIYNYSEFLIEDYSENIPQEGKDMLETLRTLSRRMETLIDNLLKYSKLSREEMIFSPVNLNKILDDTLETYSIFMKDNNAAVTVEKDMPTLKCDAAMVGEIFRNLITNGIKYNDKKYKKIHVGSFEKNNETVLFVRDNGIGIPEKHHKSIFKIFKRLHSRDEYGGGTGSGLTILRRAIDRHHGRIWIESTEGEGTTFYFTLGQ